MNVTSMPKALGDSVLCVVTRASKSLCQGELTPPKSMGYKTVIIIP